MNLFDPLYCRVSRTLSRPRSLRRLMEPTAHPTHTPGNRPRGLWRPQPRPLTASRRRILELLHHYRHLTPRLLALAYGWQRGPIGHGLSHLRHELGQLCREGLVARHQEYRRQIGDGSDERIYVLTTAGAKAILDAAAYTAVRHLVYRRNQRKRGNYAHHVALSELQLVLELGGNPWRVEHFASDEHRARFRLDLPAVDVPVAGPVGQVRVVGGEQRGLQPDARVLIRFPSGQRTLFLFDLDLERRANARTDTRTLAYHVLLSRHMDELKRTFAVNNVVVVFVATGERAIEHLRLRALHVVRSARSVAGLTPQPLFLFWNRQTWVSTETLHRRQGVGTPRERERVWSVSVLRDPRDILSEVAIKTLSGKPRHLIQADSAGPLRVSASGLR